ncbi:transcription factor YdeB [Bacillus anthracis]|nr:transcription factor YdeB [Bacillus anthracis]
MEVDDLFQIGDKIVYPMKGAGIIKAIEEKEIAGKKQQYYVIKMSTSKDMQIMIPEGENTKIKYTTNHRYQGTLKHIIHKFQNGESDTSLTWKQRYKVNTDKIKTGKLQESAEVVRDLMRRKKEKALNASEKKMLDNAHEFLISELGLIEGITENQIKSFC